MESMRTNTSFKPFSVSNPVIFLSQQTNSFTSFYQVKEHIKAAECQAFGSMPLISVRTYPVAASLPQYALYNFSIGISPICSVRAITYQIEKTIIHVWTFISQRSRVVRQMIYEKELLLMDKYPDLLFDFNTVHLSSNTEAFIPQDLKGNLIYYSNMNGN
jgi:hypothetical protein